MNNHDLFKSPPLLIQREGKAKGDQALLQFLPPIAGLDAVRIQLTPTLISRSTK